MAHPALASVVAVAAGLEDVVEPDAVGLYVCVWIGYGVAHPCLGGEVHDDVRLKVGEYPADQLRVGNVAVHELP